jgi:hypothetical protein
MEPRCKVCQLKEIDPAFHDELFKEKKSLRQLQRMTRQKYKETGNEIYNLSYSSFRRHMIAGEKHYD